MCDPETNYVFVDEELDIIRVYDNQGEIAPVEFAGPSRIDRRARAEGFAAHVAVELGCDWGTNYG